MGVRIVRREAERQCVDTDYVRVCTCSDPNDDTVTLATIQRIVDKSNGMLESERNWRVKTLVVDKPMSPHDALGLATCYAERKGIPVVYSV
jgi:hypothetical protein